MSDTRSTVWDAPRIEVRVHRDGHLPQRELCDGSHASTDDNDEEDR